MSRTCQSIGVCQHRTPPCRGCEPIHFAPGVIQSPASRRQRRSLWRWLYRAVGLMLLVVTIAFWVGLLTGRIG